MGLPGRQNLSRACTSILPALIHPYLSYEPAKTKRPENQTHQLPIRISYSICIHICFPHFKTYSVTIDICDIHRNISFFDLTLVEQRHPSSLQLNNFSVVPLITIFHICINPIFAQCNYHCKNQFLSLKLRYVLFHFNIPSIIENDKYSQNNSKRVLGYELINIS